MGVLQRFYSNNATGSVPAHTSGTVSSISSPQEKMLFSIETPLIRKHTKDTHAHSAGIVCQLLRHSRHCEAGSSTALQATVRHMETPGGHGRWSKKCYLRAHCVFLLYNNSKMLFLHLSKKLFYIFLIKSLKGGRQKPTCNLFRFKVCSAALHVTMHLAKDSS